MATRNIVPALDNLRKPVTKKRPHPGRMAEMGAFALDRRAVDRALRFLLRHVEICGLRRVVGDPTAPVVRFAKAEVCGADHAVGGPWEAHHSADPGEGAGVALVNAIERQDKATDGHHP